MAGIYFDATYKKVILRDKPSLYWPLNQADGATDQSGNARNGSGGTTGISLGGFASSPITDENTCTEFDGVDDVITSTYNPFTGTGTSRTFTGWALRDLQTWNVLFGSNLGYPNTVLLQGFNGNNDAQFTIGAGGTAGTWTNALPLATWFHWALILVQGIGLELFINGVSQGALAATDAYVGGASLWIGAYGGGNYMDGKMAQVAVFEYAQHVDRIQAHVTAATA